MVKKQFISIFILIFISIANNVMADEYKDYRLENVPEEFIGTYIPVQYDNILTSTRSHVLAMGNWDKYHDILLLSDEFCYSDAGFHDSYGIRKDEFKEYSFVENSNGKYIIDINGNSYRKISNNIGVDGYNDFEAYVLSIIFQDATSLKNVSLQYNKVLIDGIEFTAILDLNFFETEDVSIWLFGNGNQHALKIDGISAKLYDSDYVRVFRSVSDRCFIEFPMFYWEDKKYPNIKSRFLPSTLRDLRYMRNLIFARHGYVFKSQDLQKLYESFSWYKRNTSFSEDDFTREEKELLDRIISYEEYLKS